MTDTPKPPPLPTVIPLARFRTKRESILAAENRQLRADLESERALIEILRNQPTYREARAAEETLSGLGAPQRYRGKPGGRKPSSGRPRRGKWVVLICALLGLTAGLASLRYPQLMAPIEAVQKAVESWK